MESNENLLKKLIQAAAKAGRSGSGLVIDVMHGENVKNLQTIKQEVLARMNVTPPPGA